MAESPLADNLTRSSDPQSQAEPDGLSRQLGLGSAVAAVAGESIAVGIFLTPAGMALSLGSPFWIIVRVASFFPFHATYWLNGHSFIERELTKAGIGFHKNHNAFLAVDDVAALQAAAADRLSPQIIRKQLDYWTLILGPKFSKKERSQMSLSRFYAIAQIEYCRNFIFKRHFPIHKIFERSCEIGLWRMTANRISEIFGVRLTKKLRGKLATVIEQIEHGHHVFRVNFKNACSANMRSSLVFYATNCYRTI